MMLLDAIYDTYGLCLFMIFGSHANLVTRYTLSSPFGIPTISVGFDRSVLNIWSL